jgi:CRP-like cAMP-binding protein
MSIVELLKHIELFSGLTSEQIEHIAALGHEASYNAGDVIISEGAPSDEIYVICDGLVEVEIVKGAVQDVPGAPQFSSIVRLGKGQVFGEMALVDSGARSATVRCTQNGTILYVIPHREFWDLFENDHHIGFIVMRNIAADLSFKLRHRNLQTRLAGGAA